MKIQLLLLSFLILSISGFSQEDRFEFVLNRAEKYYDSAKTFSLVSVTKNKNALIIDTSSNEIHFFSHRPEAKLVFINKEGTGMLIDGKSQYEINFSKNEYLRIKPKDYKTYIYDGLYRNYIFNSPTDFIANLRQKKMRHQESDSTWIFIGKGTFYEFRKSNYSLRSVKLLKYDKLNDAFQYSETTFSDLDFDSLNVKQQLNAAHAIVSSASNLKKREPVIRPNKIDISFLMSKITDKDSAGSVKLIFLDFFFQGCYPCVLSIPKIKELQRYKPGSINIIGIDTRLQDSSSLGTYIKKYGIDYPVIGGAKANQIEKEIGIEVWPTFIILDLDGNILEYSEGLTDAFFNKVKRKYLKN